MRSWPVGSATVVRIPDDEFDLVLPQDDPTARALRANASWLAPNFITEDGALRIGSSAIGIRSRGRRIVVDPWLAFDGPDRSAPDARRRIDRLLAALAGAGFPPDEVDVVVDSHIDGVGANTRPTGDGAEVPAFPNARYVYSRDEIDALEAGQRPGAEALLVLRDARRLEMIDGDVSITDEVTVRAAPGHCSGHLSVRVDSGGDHAAVIGHLFLHPAQIFATDRTAGDADPAVLHATRTALLSEFCATHTLVIGPLFAEPGAGHIAEHEGSWRLDAVA